MGANRSFSRPVRLDGGTLTASDIERIASGARLELDTERLAGVAANRRALADAEASGCPIFGATTGLGALVRHDLEPDRAADPACAIGEEERADRVVAGGR
jgi:histidine ammonia-lyase